MSAPDARNGRRADSSLPPGEIERLAELARGIAEAAGDLILETVAGLGRTRLRADAATKSSRTDLATEADRRSERLVRDALAAARPDDAVLGEEAGATSGRSGLTWIVDPLDGTTNFVYGFPAWSVSIALADADGPLIGVVRDPERRETFEARRGGGAALDGHRLRLAAPAPLAETLVGTGFGYDAARRAAQAALLPGLLPAVRDIRRAGSAALDLCWVASGRLDAFYEAGLNVWDSAAGALIATEAGAAIAEVDDLVPGASTLVVAAPARLAELVSLLHEAAGRSPATE